MPPVKKTNVLTEEDKNRFSEGIFNRVQAELEAYAASEKGKKHIASINAEQELMRRFEALAAERPADKDSPEYNEWIEKRAYLTRVNNGSKGAPGEADPFAESVRTSRSQFRKYNKALQTELESQLIGKGGNAQNDPESSPLARFYASIAEAVPSYEPPEWESDDYVNRREALTALTEGALTKWRNMNLTPPDTRFTDPQQAKLVGTRPIGELRASETATLLKWQAMPTDPALREQAGAIWKIYLDKFLNLKELKKNTVEHAKDVPESWRAVQEKDYGIDFADLIDGLQQQGHFFTPEEYEAYHHAVVLREAIMRHAAERMMQIINPFDEQFPMPELSWKSDEELRAIFPDGDQTPYRQLTMQMAGALREERERDLASEKNYTDYADPGCTVPLSPDELRGRLQDQTMFFRKEYTFTLHVRSYSNTRSVKVNEDDNEEELTLRDITDSDLRITLQHGVTQEQAAEALRQPDGSGITEEIFRDSGQIREWLSALPAGDSREMTLLGSSSVRPMVSRDSAGRLAGLSDMLKDVQARPAVNARTPEKPGWWAEHFFQWFGIRTSGYRKWEDDVRVWEDAVRVNEENARIRSMLRELKAAAAEQDELPEDLKEEPEADILPEAAGRTSPDKTVGNEEKQVGAAPAEQAEPDPVDTVPEPVRQIRREAYDRLEAAQDSPDEAADAIVTIIACVNKQTPEEVAQEKEYLKQTNAFIAYSCPLPSKDNKTMFRIEAGNLQTLHAMDKERRAQPLCDAESRMAHEFYELDLTLDGYTEKEIRSEIAERFSAHRPNGNDGPVMDPDGIVPG